MSKQLEIELPKEYEATDKYKAAFVEYMRCIEMGIVNTFLVYNSNRKSFFVSRFSQESTVKSYKSFKIILPL